MKIALVATEKLPVPAVRGGAIQIYLQSFAPIVAKTHEVTVLSVKDPGLKERETIDGVSFVHFDQNRYVEQTAAHLKRNRYDVIHVCNRPAWIEKLHQASPESRWVLSIHNDMFSPEKIGDQAGERCIRLVDRITTVSDYIALTITERFPQSAGKVTTVRSGVALHTFEPLWSENGRHIREEMRRELNLEGRKVILFVGRLSKVKGPHLLLQAIPEVVNKHPDAVLVFVGSKWFGDNAVNKYVKFLYTLAALYPEHVRFIKFVKPSDIHKLYTMSDVFVCTSQWQEPLARVHYEAMAAGLPIITTNRGGNSEVIEEGDNGYVIDDYTNPDAYAEKINVLLDDGPLREQMGRKGRKYAEKHNGWESVAQNLLVLYEGASAGKGGRQ